jgi:hypothetical protein
MIHRNERQRLLKAIFLAGLTGTGILALVRYLVLPALRRGLTGAQVEWLRESFQMHPNLVLLTILLAAAILGLPVLLVSLWAARLGPCRRKAGSRNI